MLTTGINYKFYQYDSLILICVAFINGFDYNPAQIKKTDNNNKASFFTLEFFRNWEMGPVTMALGLLFRLAKITQCGSGA